MKLYPTESGMDMCPETVREGGTLPPVLRPIIDAEVTVRMSVLELEALLFHASMCPDPIE